jgi:hypothetical protein
MARKLKTYQTSLGFFEQAIAAPSMKAAPEGMGRRQQSFPSRCGAGHRQGASGSEQGGAGAKAAGGRTARRNRDSREEAEGRRGRLGRGREAVEGGVATRARLRVQAEKPNIVALPRERLCNNEVKRAGHSRTGQYDRGALGRRNGGTTSPKSGEANERTGRIS